MKKRILVALLVFVALLTGCNRKETPGQWPSQKIEIDVCYTAGGTADTVARQLSALMSQQLSTTFNLVNVTGGSGSIAGQQVYAAAHDGYTWLGDVAHTVSGWRTLGYADLGWEDFYGFYAASSPYVLFVSGNSPYQTAQQLFDAMRGDPSMKWGNAGLGSINQLTGSLMLEKLGLKAPAVSETGTIVHVAIEGMYAGYLLIADVVKPHSAQAIRGLKDAGVRKTVMLTGDAEPVAKAVSAELGLDEYHAGLLPGDKVDQIETLLAAKRPKENLAFVGDGINDAPVLSRADVGIAMGALGSDAAIEAADVVLMDDDPAKIALAMRIARRTLRIVYQNIVFALAIKFACLVLGAIGMASMWTAIFADVGVMVLAVLNATRALYTKDLANKNEQ